VVGNLREQPPSHGLSSPGGRGEGRYCEQV